MQRPQLYSILAARCFLLLAILVIALLYRSESRAGNFDRSSLIHADDWLNAVYSTIVRNLGAEEKERLKKKEREWIKYKESLPEESQLAAVRARISELEHEHGGKSELTGQPSDAEIKAKLLGYWQSPRHAYLLKSDGIMYMCPTNYATTKNTWDVKGGLFYQDGQPHRIVTLNRLEFVYEPINGAGDRFPLLRTTEKEAEGR
jgi:lysozyme inhibitor LprI